MRRLNRESQEVNVRQGERMLSLLGGGALLLYVLKRRSVKSIIPALVSAELLYCGVTGHCHVYELLGVSTADGGRTGAEVHTAVTVNRAPEDVYRFWRNLENLPRFMRHLSSVEMHDDRRSHWVADMPTGVPLAWDAEITDDRANELIRWETVPGAPVQHHGSVRFKPAPGYRGTEVLVTIAYDPPAGTTGEAVAHLLNVVTARQIEEDVRRFKHIMEAGELPTIEGQPAGQRLARDQMLLALAGKE